MGPVGTAVLGVAAITAGLLVVLPTFLAERRIDLADTCQTGETGKCFTREAGVVDSFDTEMKVLYDDGLKSTSVVLVDNLYLEPRTRVLLERWNGDVVSVVDVAGERRFRTLAWPDADSSGGWTLVLFGGLFLGIGLFRLVGRFLV